jgi:nucleoside-diphosphate-sugar epimerase
LNACLELGVERLVTTSSSEVYSPAVRVRVDETHRLDPQSPYGASKAAADHMVESYSRSFGLPAVIIRPFNVFGPRQSMRSLIAKVVVQALSGGLIEIGAATRAGDFTFVKDIVNGYALAGVAPDASGEMFNLGTGQEHSAADVIQAVSEILGAELQVCEASGGMWPRSSEVHGLVADSSKATLKLGWSPQYTLFDGLKEAVEWYEVMQKSSPVRIHCQQ